MSGYDLRDTIAGGWDSGAAVRAAGEASGR